MSADPGPAGGSADDRWAAVSPEQALVQRWLLRRLALVLLVTAGVVVAVCLGVGAAASVRGDAAMLRFGGLGVVLGALALLLSACRLPVERTSTLALADVSALRARLREGGPLSPAQLRLGRCLRVEATRWSWSGASRLLSVLGVAVVALGAFLLLQVITGRPGETPGGLALVPVVGAELVFLVVQGHRIGRETAGLPGAGGPGF